jgi:hypothetical protein
VRWRVGQQPFHDLLRGELRPEPRHHLGDVRLLVVLAQIDLPGRPAEAERRQVTGNGGVQINPGEHGRLRGQLGTTAPQESLPVGVGTSGQLGLDLGRLTVQPFEQRGNPGFGPSLPLSGDPPRT